MVRRLGIAAVLCALALAARAETKHVVSRIEVRGGVPAGIVVSQSALVAGRSYSDADLDAAVARIRRLPFVFHASHSLEGETLVVEVGATSRFFGELDAAGTAFRNDQSGIAALSGGGRMFLGSAGVASASVHELVAEHEDTTAVDLEYGHYGIGGSRLFALGGVNYQLERDESLQADPAFRLVLGYPLTVRQTLTASVSRAGFESSTSLALLSQALRSSSETRTLALRWTWDTTDDPFFARRGLLIDGGPAWTRDESRFDTLSIIFPGLGPGFEVVTIASERETVAWEANARRFWSVGSRGAVVTGAGVRFDQVESDEGRGDAGFVPDEFESRTASVSLGYSQNLFDEIERMQPLRQRVEGSVAYHRSEIDLAAPYFGGAYTSGATVLSAAYVLRWNFGTVRLGLSYSFEDVTTPAPLQPRPPFVAPMK